MPSSITISGVTGEIRWGYHVVATLRDWTVSDGRLLSATVITLDGFGVSQRPLTFVAPHDHGAWRWKVETLQSEGASLVAGLGPRE